MLLPHTMPGLGFQFFLDQQGKKGPARRLLNWQNYRNGSIKIIASVFVILFFTVSLILLIAVIQNPQALGDLRSRAWSGAQVNADIVRARLGGLAVPGETKTDPNPVKKERTATTTTLDGRTLFHNLTRTYYNAEVQNISEPTLNIHGVAFLAYDKDLDATFIYSSIGNMPEPVVGFLRLWLVDPSDRYTPVGIAEFITENKISVAYSVFTGKGDLRSNKELLFSYDTAIEEASPGAVALTLKF